jgi:hypothetical protein
MRGTLLLHLPGRSDDSGPAYVNRKHDGFTPTKHPVGNSVSHRIFDATYPYNKTCANMFTNSSTKNYVERWSIRYEQLITPYGGQGASPSPNKSVLTMKCQERAKARAVEVVSLLQHLG